MRQAGTYWAKQVAVHGGYVWEYSTDFVTRRRGESGNLPLTTNWVQYPGTPAVGMAFLSAYEATGERLYLDAAVAAAHCLAWGQLKSGGWTYSVEFDPSRNRYLYHHLTRDNMPNGRPLLDTTTFDDDNTQSATRFVMAVDQYVDDAKIDAAIERALKCFLAAQYKGGLWDGAWPQRYPAPTRGYGGYPTFNDNTMSDCVKTMLAAHKQYHKPEHLGSVKRCLEFYLRSQQPAPQSTWAQQYGYAAELRVGEVADWPGFCSKLKRASEALPSLGKRIWGVLPKQQQEAVDQASRGVELEIDRKYMLVKALNAILRRRDFCQDEDLARLALPDEAKELLARDRRTLAAGDVLRLNRLVLEAAYPLEIAKCRSIPKPAWARRFEPPSVTGGESVGNMRLLMDIYIEFGDERYLDAVGRAVEWFRRSRIGGTEQNGVWARFYELGTNRPLYFTRTYQLVYTHDDLPVHYSFKSGYGVNSCIRRYEAIRSNGRDHYLAQRDRQNGRDRWPAVSKAAAAKVEGIAAAQDHMGRWVKVVPYKEQVRDKQGRVGYVVDDKKMVPMVYSAEFIKNMRALASYVTAAQRGPRVTAPAATGRQE